MSDMTLMNTTYVGGNGSDVGSTLQFPYVLVSGENSVQVSSGGNGTGPALMKINVQAIAETTSISTSVTQSQS